jgi:ADP-heptose:LPS heptosyltransferase
VHKGYRPTPAALQVGPRGQTYAKLVAGSVLLNPYIKPRASPNKQWGLERWQELIRLTPGVRWIQLLEPGMRRLRSVVALTTHHFMDAVGAISGADVLVCHEGALHHAAAAVGTPAIVLRGGYTYGTTEYDGQVNFSVRDERYPYGCGMRIECEHCAAAMASIQPDQVARALLNLLNQKPGRPQ